ncbi:Omp28-related outer membrane protein [Psychroflexus aestuariivivens]|uniref:Omp28-related outer membrane protein n=1 Tax=Psychroflexus aestuariivivens TaxID=1795040 RepID=UPI000FDC8C2C|nr:Omp28-related outer membrane protein [Psychroflexus aestuariivivens]
MKNVISRYSFALITVLFLLLGCSEKYETIEGVSGMSNIFATYNSSTQTIGEETIIRVFTEEGEEITDESIISVNGENIQGSSFIADEVGLYEIEASHANQKAPNLTVEYHDGSQKYFKKRVLIEDYTGTWCGWCPRVSYAMKKVQEIKDEVVFLAIHRAPSGTADPYNYTNAEPLEQMINAPGYPKGFINRIHQWDFPEPFKIYQVVEFTHGSNPKLGLAINSSLNNDKITINVKVDFAQDFQNLKLVVQVLENGLVWPQVNYTDYYEGLDPVENYVHDYTLRSTLTNILGDEIPNAQTRIDNEWQKTIEYEISNIVEDESQLDIIAFVVDENNEVVNVRKASLGENQDFEILD